VAEMIPDRLPRKASVGEDRMFNVLKKLPDDHLVYYEPVVADRYPDFIVLLPDIGLLVIEVKGWYRNHILEANNEVVTVRSDNGPPSKQKHPVRQARDYMLRLMDECRGRPEFRPLLQKDGRGFKFPFSHLAVLSNITSQQLGDLTPLFPSPRTICRDVLLEWDMESFNYKALQKAIKSSFDPFWKFERLSGAEMDLLRAIIHPEIVIQKPAKEKTGNLSLAVLDLQQEREALNIGDGHRLIFGVAGSGKTVLLISRARWLASQKPDAPILVLCYNRALSAFLSNALGDCRNVHVQNFHRWANAQGVRMRDGDEFRSNREIGDSLLTQLRNGQGEAMKYGAVFVDEAQDFEPVWFACAREALKDPNSGDLLITGDALQGLYERRRVTWSSLDIQARGRTTYLDRNYRNTREVLDLASVFAQFDAGDAGEDSIASVPIDASKSVRSGVLPIFTGCAERDQESQKIVEVVRGLLEGRWGNQEIPPLQRHEIGILYPRISKPMRKDFLGLLEDLRSLATTIWISDPENRSNANLVHEDALKVQTIHSAKGLQYRAVIVIWSDLLPHGDPDKVIEDRKLLYVALTRPEEFLAITATGTSEFVSKIIESGKVEVVA